MTILLRVMCFDKDRALSHEIYPLLSPGRREKVLRICLPSGAKTCAYGELLLRHVLGEVYGKIPAVSYGENQYGKPNLTSHPGIFYSLSDTDGCVAVAVGDSELGLDIERLRPVDMRTARRFTQAEREYVGGGDGADERFFALWTRKEAFMKYRGMGFSLPMKSFSALPDGQGEHIASRRTGELFIALCAGDAEPDFEMSIISEDELLDEYGIK